MSNWLSQRRIPSLQKFKSLPLLCPFFPSFLLVISNSVHVNSVQPPIASHGQRPRLHWTYHLSADTLSDPRIRDSSAWTQLKASVHNASLSWSGYVHRPCQLQGHPLLELSEIFRRLIRRSLQNAISILPGRIRHRKYTIPSPSTLMPPWLYRIFETNAGVGVFFTPAPGMS